MNGSHMRVYLDYNATTPLAPEVVDAVVAATRDLFGNASSVHHFGQQAKAAIDDARTSVATLIGADPSEVVFTSGGTEADNLAIRGAAEAAEPTGRRHLVASAIEHEAVLNTFKALARRGWRTTLVPVDQRGIVSPDRVREAMADDTALVSVMHANNEIGTIQPIAEIAAIAHERGALMHTDAVQSAGKIPVDVRALGVDLLAVAAHKLNGPKGAGALWVKRGTRMLPILTGGKHERSRRAGTENVPAIAGFGTAARLAASKLQTRGRPDRGAARSPRSNRGQGHPWHSGERRPRRARAQHHEHQLRPGGGRKPPDRARPGRDRRVDRFGMLVGNAGALACAPRDGLSGPPDPELAAVQPRLVLHRARMSIASSPCSPRWSKSFEG